MDNSEERGKIAVQRPTGDNLKRDFKGPPGSDVRNCLLKGTGLTISSGAALTRGGPCSLLISYLLIGLAVFFMAALGEMAAYIPMKKGFSGYASRYAHLALGLGAPFIYLRAEFATGWNYFFSYAIAIPTNLTAAGLIIHYWRPDLNVGIWITVFGVAVILLNVTHINDFGESEFILSCIKLIAITTLILCCFIISAGALLLAKKWASSTGTAPAHLGRTEIVGVTFGEASNPRKTIPMAIRQTFWRILSFYVIGVCALTVAVPYTSPELVDATSKSTSAAASPFVVAISLAGIKVLPDIVNAGLLVLVVSSAASDPYYSSCSLYGLAKDGQAPKLLAKTLKNGVPAWSVGFAALFCELGYMNAAKSASTIFEYFVSLATIFALLNWLSILLPYVNFRRGLERQEFSLKERSYCAVLQPYGVYYSMFITVLCDAFTPQFKANQFVLRYVGIVVYVGNFLFWRFYKGARHVRPGEMDLTTGFYNSVLEGSSDQIDVEVPKKGEIEARASEVEITTIGEDGKVAGR
ncbi:amino acid permease-domain-containing protein [Aspergillus foveolatus]|uniref:amino acid permease-domain-containing protein n=1 Tax=Aspergillus foveolatus TaxID=210207 RepID=UPI003CCCD0EA